MFDASISDAPSKRPVDFNSGTAETDVPTVVAKTVSIHYAK